MISVEKCVYHSPVYFDGYSAMFDEVHRVTAASGFDDDVIFEVNFKMELLEDVVHEFWFTLAEEIDLT